MADIDFGRDIVVKENEPLSKHSSLRIGGNASYALFPKTQDEMIYAVNACMHGNVRYKIVGNASNILFDDSGFEGVIIFTEQQNSVEYTYKTDCVLVKAGCGKSLTELASEAGRKHSLSGLEFAYGIPGTLGGAVYMNAGAYGGQMSDIVIETDVYNIETKQIEKIKTDGHCFSYRHSVFQEKSELIILSTCIKLILDDAGRIYEKMTKNMTSRKEKQPLELPNAGSTFKRPAENIYVGKLIEELGLKGRTSGGAQISEKHAGFIVNRGGATSADVLSLINLIKSKVQNKHGIELESEIIYIPYKDK